MGAPSGFFAVVGGVQEGQNLEGLLGEEAFEGWHAGAGGRNAAFRPRWQYNAGMTRWWLALVFTLALAWAQFRESGLPELAAQLDIATEPLLPVRVYLFKDQQPFRLSPVQALLPLNVDLFYRERLWRRAPSPDTLEVTCNEQSHFFLLNGRASFDLPAGRYRVEAYRGLFYRPAVEEFELRAGERRRLVLRPEVWSGSQPWISGDDHIHLVRAPEDNDVFLKWLEAEDLSVGNFLQLQRQMDAAAQYAFGPAGEARRPGRSIRSGQESRSEFYGHINLLGARELIRPLSINTIYANSAAAYPFPAVLFARGRALGGTVGFAHFHGSQPHSTLLMDLALGNIDFTEVFQFGRLWTQEWYELLNAGFRVTGIAGSDFPVPLNRVKPWPRWLPLLGPERTLVKGRPRESAYETWAEGVRKGEVVVSNGPLVELTVDRAASTATAAASFFRPLEKLEIVRNGQVIAAVPGDGSHAALSAVVRFDASESCWLAARTTARRLEGEPEIQAHTNPAYVLTEGRPVLVRTARETLATRWESELNYFRSANLPFATEAQRREFFTQAERALEILRNPR